MTPEVPELERLGWFIRRARQDAGLNQAELAERSDLMQAQISYLESGRRRPALDQLLRLAKALDVPVQRLLSGSDRPGIQSADIAMELRSFGIRDLWVSGMTVPGAFRRPEEVVSIVLSGREPDPRVIEAIPAILAWNEIDPTLLRAHGAIARTMARIAWLADITLAIDNQGGFPGGCQRRPLELFLKQSRAGRKLGKSRRWDDLGKTPSSPPASPIWKRWSISYDASLNQFEERARHLDNLRAEARGWRPYGPAAKAKESRKENGPGRP